MPKYIVKSLGVMRQGVIIARHGEEVELSEAAAAHQVRDGWLVKVDGQKASTPSKPEPVKADPPKPEPVKVEAPKPEPVKEEPPKPEPPKPEPLVAEPPKVGDMFHGQKGRK